VAVAIPISVAVAAALEVIASATGKSQVAVLPEVMMHSVAPAEPVEGRLRLAARAGLPASVVLEVVVAAVVVDEGNCRREIRHSGSKTFMIWKNR
jgi:hypothetical protein